MFLISYYNMLKHVEFLILLTCTFQKSKNKIWKIKNEKLRKYNFYMFLISYFNMFKHVEF